MNRNPFVLLACALLGVCLIAACGAGQAKDGAPGSQATAQGAPQALRRGSATPFPGPLTVGRSGGVPAGAEAASLRLLAAAGLEAVAVASDPDVEITARFSGGDVLAYEAVLAPVDRFPSTLEAVTMQELQDSWTGRRASTHFTTIFPSQEIAAELEELLGPAGPAVKPQAPEEVSGAVWGDPMSIGIVPFDALTPRLRSLEVDGASVGDNKLASSDWPLASRAWLHPRTERGRQAVAQAAGGRPTTNRDLDRLTVLAVTGVTAIARNTATAIEQAGDNAFPARLVGPDLAAADLTITSNEISFVEGCVADNSLGLMLFCAKPEYFATLELSGIDAVGLTGNHLNDFGYENTLASLDFYATAGMPVYGGGANEEEARVPLILEHHGNRLAFLGANQFGPAEYEPNDAASRDGAGTLPVSAWAGPENPGAAFFDREQMIADIQAVKPKVDLVFAEVQHTEFSDAGEYQTEPLPEQVDDFRALIEGGADVVTGVQAHAPQAVELPGDGMILYGLGNLYFDQTWSWPTRTGLVAWHTIYEGRLLNTHLSVTVIDPNFQVRWATPEERRTVLQSVFDASAW
jgi:poly-gamma-glutamate capsule biosynthesis protein CapA/YwtB (metallophosphatase superfamily)